MSGRRTAHIIATARRRSSSLGLALPAVGERRIPVGRPARIRSTTRSTASRAALGGATSGVTGGAAEQQRADPAVRQSAHLHAARARQPRRTVKAPWRSATSSRAPSPRSPVIPRAARPSSGEEVVVGRSRGEQRPSGELPRPHHDPGPARAGDPRRGLRAGPERARAAGPIQTQVLDAICQGSGNQLCLTVLKADSSTTADGSSNAFEAAGAHVGGAERRQRRRGTSNGSISQTAHCQTAHSDSGVAAANVGSLTADALQSSSDSRACNNAGPSQSGSSTVVEPRRRRPADPGGRVRERHGELVVHGARAAARDGVQRR